MARQAALLLAALLLAAAPLRGATAPAGPGSQLPVDGARPRFAKQGPAFAPKRLLVKLRPVPTSIGGVSTAVEAAGRLPGIALTAALGAGSASSRRRLLAAAQAVGSGEAVGVFAIQDGMTVPAKVEQLMRLPGVAWASPDAILYRQDLDPTEAAAGVARNVRLGRRLLASTGARNASSDSLEFIPNDPSWGELWHLPAVDAPHAWPYGAGGSQAKICVIDTGMQQGHPDLPQPVAGWNTVPRVDARGNVLGFPAPGDADYNDYNDQQFHGTHVTGIAAALGNNSVGVAGLAFQADVMVCRVYNATQKGAYLSSIMLCAQNCVEAGAAIVSMSLGSRGYVSAYEEVARRLKRAGVLWFVPAGNDGRTFGTDYSTWDYPAGLAAKRFPYDNVVAVAALGRDGLIASYSNRGPQVMQLAAPGSYILSTLPFSQGLYGRLSGTSMATPLAAAAAAQLTAAYQARHGKLPGYLAVKQALLAAVDPFPNGSKFVSTGGTLNVGRAMHRLVLGDASYGPPVTPPSQNPANYTSTIQRLPGVRLVHYTESASFFQPLSGRTLQQCTQACVNDLRCGKYVYFRSPAATYINSRAYNCLLWSADAEIAYKKRNARVESGLVVRKYTSRSSTPSSQPLPPAPNKRQE